MSQELMRLVVRGDGGAERFCHFLYTMSDACIVYYHRRTYAVFDVYEKSERCHLSIAVSSSAFGCRPAEHT